MCFKKASCKPRNDLDKQTANMKKLYFKVLRSVVTFFYQFDSCRKREVEKQRTNSTCASVKKPESCFIGIRISNISRQFHWQILITFPVSDWLILHCKNLILHRKQKKKKKENDKNTKFYLNSPYWLMTCCNLLTFL